jgi:hypothetical protein
VLSMVRLSVVIPPCAIPDSIQRYCRGTRGRCERRIGASSSRAVCRRVRGCGYNQTSRGVVAWIGLRLIRKVSVSFRIL